jgi:UDP-N-acetylmuramoyl-tripeptide--D-alanyl-D-alanine ligase
MGANHPHEIAYLSGIAQPDVAVITNAGAAHLEGFGDLDGVARAKGEIISGLAAEGIAVLNADDPRLPIWQELAADKSMLTFGFSPTAGVKIDPVSIATHWTDSGFHTHLTVQSGALEFPVNLALAGKHNLLNALAAIAACQALGSEITDIQQGLATLKPVSGRLRTRIAVSGLRVIDDSYNANPDSMTAAIDVLKGAPGRRFLVMGDLAELGKDAVSLHFQVGESAKAAGIDALWGSGGMSRAAVDGFGGDGRYFPDREALIAALKETLTPQDTVLVKGSRSAGMEHVVSSLLQAGED